MKVHGALLWVAFLTVVLASLVDLAHSTAAVRLANSDDVAFQTVVDQGTEATYLVDNARSQGRIYFACPLYRVLLLGPYRLGTGAFNLLRTLLFSIEAFLLGGLVARAFRSPPVGAAVTLVLIAVLQIPRTFYLVLSYTPMAVGFVALLLSLHCHLCQLRRGSAWSRLGTPTLFLLACFCSEIFVLGGVLYFALSLLEDRTNTSQLVRDNGGILLAGAGFATVYFIFASEYRSVYDGTRLAFHPILAVEVIIRQLIGIIPGYELVIDRDPAHAWRLPWPLVISKLRQLQPTDLALAAAQTMTSVWLLLRGTAGAARILRPAIIIALLGVAVNLPIALTRKYQVLLFHREAPYAYAFYTFCSFVVVAVVLLTWLMANSARGRRLVLTASALLILSASLVAKASNRWALPRLGRTFASGLQDSNMVR